jgi:hypothetical protein
MLYKQCDKFRNNKPSVQWNGLIKTLRVFLVLSMSTTCIFFLIIIYLINLTMHDCF